MASFCATAAFLLLLAVAADGAGRALLSNVDNPERQPLQLGKKDVKKDKHRPYTSPTGLFIQERASKQLPGPGQHFSFGALQPWEKIHEVLDDTPDSKLVFLVRHGQAVSNFLSDSLGPDEWFRLESECSYTDDNNTFWGIFDAELTDLGKAEATSLNSMLKDGGWYDKLTNGHDARAIVSPLSRCLQTTLITLNGLPVKEFNVEENVRETLGEDTCDARRAASDPRDGDPDHLIGPCQFTAGLKSKFPTFDFPVVESRLDQGPVDDDDDDALGDEDAEEEVYSKGKRFRTEFGLTSDADTMWTKDRETQAHQTRRALHFLDDLFALAPEPVVFVVTHSGFTRSVLLAVGREPYRPQNTELVPVIITRRADRAAAAAATTAAGEAL